MISSYAANFWHACVYFLCATLHLDRSFQGIEARDAVGPDEDELKSGHVQVSVFQCSIEIPRWMGITPQSHIIRPVDTLTSHEICNAVRR